MYGFAFKILRRVIVGSAPVLLAMLLHCYYVCTVFNLSQFQVDFHKLKCAINHSKISKKSNVCADFIPVCSERLFLHKEQTWPRGIEQEKLSVLERKHAKQI